MYIYETLFHVIYFNYHRQIMICYREFESIWLILSTPRFENIHVRNIQREYHRLKLGLALVLRIDFYRNSPFVDVIFLMWSLFAVKRKNWEVYSCNCICQILAKMWGRARKGYAWQFWDEVIGERLNHAQVQDLESWQHNKIVRFPFHDEFHEEDMISRTHQEINSVTTGFLYLTKK